MELTCICGKKCYTEKEAGEVLNTLKVRRKKHSSSQKKARIPKRKYYCEECGYYHLTHRTHYKHDRHKINWN